MKKRTECGCYQDAEWPTPESRYCPKCGEQMYYSEPCQNPKHDGVTPGWSFCCGGSSPAPPGEMEAIWVRYVDAKFAIDEALGLGIQMERNYEPPDAGDALAAELKARGHRADAPQGIEKKEKGE